MFSVVIPLFNKAPYLQRALDSVYAQNCPVDEIIVVNDGSTDGGERIAKDQNDPRVRVIDQANCGVSVARNVGIANAAQPYVAFLDADDAWLPGFLAQVKQMIEKFPEAGLYGTGFATVAEGREVRRYGVRLPAIGTERTYSPLHGGGCERLAFGPVDFFMEWSREHVIHTSSMVVPKRVAREVGGFQAGVTICEDHEFWAKIARSYPVVLSPAILTRYHVDVPGQAAEYWQKGYKQVFEVLPYHRFLAEKMREISDAAGGEKEASGNKQSAIGNGERREVLKCESSKVLKCGSALGGERESNGNERSFVLYCRKEFAKCLLQRLYWGNFQAASEFYQTLGLNHRDYGVIVSLCGWVANHRGIHPVMCLAMRAVRWMRGRL